MGAGIAVSEVISNGRLILMIARKVGQVGQDGCHSRRVQELELYWRCRAAAGGGGAEALHVSIAWDPTTILLCGVSPQRTDRGQGASAGVQRPKA